MIDQSLILRYNFSEKELEQYLRGEEIWRDIKGYEGLYQASSFGNIKSFHKRKGLNIVLQFGRSQSGYRTVVLCKDKIKKDKTVHSLIAIAFLSHEPNGFLFVVNHKNHNPIDNYIDNLEIITQRENANLKHIPHSSKYTGVSWAKNCNRWKAEIRTGRKSKYLGVFKNEEDAAKAYQDELERINRLKLEQNV
jgi:hypothetical protein